MFAILYVCVCAVLLIYLIESSKYSTFFSQTIYFYAIFFPPLVIKIATMPEQDSDRSVLLRVDGI